MENERGIFNFSPTMDFNLKDKATENAKEKNDSSSCDVGDYGYQQFLSFEALSNVCNLIAFLSPCSLQCFL